MRRACSMAIGQDEEETKRWDRFWFSGSVEDYLRYKSCHQEEQAAYCKGEDRKFSEGRERFT